MKWKRTCQLKKADIEVEIVHNIVLSMCEISMHALASLSSPQTLKIVGYIEKQKGHDTYSLRK